MVECSQRAMQLCGLSQGARDVTSLPEFLCHDLTYITDRLQVAQRTLIGS